MNPSKPLAFIDVECYQNFFCLNILTASGKRATFERSPRRDFDPDQLRKVMRGFTTVGYNSRSYDMPMITMALSGALNQDLKKQSDRIILTNVKHWEHKNVIDTDHIDLFEVNPGIKQSLKMANGRLHGRTMQDLPYPPGAVLTYEQMDEVVRYCFNDLDGTQLLYQTLLEPLELRSTLSKTYGIDFRSLSDAQMGERIFKARLGTKLPKPPLSTRRFQYQCPEWIQFDTPQMQQALEIVTAAEFVAEIDRSTEFPDTLKKLKVSLGGAVIQLGIGGLHSTEANRCAIADEDHEIVDVDVASQYPNIIAKLGLSVAGLGQLFSNEYRAVITERVEAKRRGDKVVAEAFKLALNGGVFGKFGSRYSAFYSPENLIATTLTGQLSVLMLCEVAAGCGIEILSVNTDGVTFRCRKDERALLEQCCEWWQGVTEFELEKVNYAAIYNSSVNTYIAVKPDGKTKRKGALADYWSAGDYRGMLMHNPQMVVCSNAVVEFLVRRTPIEDTIRSCQDVRQFVTVTNVSGGAKWREQYLGKVVRYYWSTDGDAILYVKPHPKTGNFKKVSKSDGAKPMMRLLDALPSDIDLDRYIANAYSILADIGYRDERDLPILGSQA